MINLSEYQIPTNVPELVRNMSCVLKHGFFLGKNCEVLNEDPIENPNKIIKQIETVFYRVIKTPSEYSDLVNLEICLDMYDQLLAFQSRDVSMLSLERPSVFSILMTKIDKICTATPKKGEDLALEVEVQEILNKQNTNKEYLQALLSFLVVNQRFYENANLHIHLRLHDLYIRQKVKERYTVLEDSQNGRSDVFLLAPGNFHDSDIEALSEIDLGLGLRFANFFDSSTKKGKIEFQAKKLSKDSARNMIEVLKEISERGDITESLKDFALHTIDFAFWQYITIIGQAFRKGLFKAEYKKYLESYNALFPGNQFINRITWPFENIGLCKKIIHANAALFSDPNEDSIARDFKDTFFNKYQFVLYRHLLPFYQKIYRTGYQVLFPFLDRMSLKEKREVFRYQKFYQTTTEVLITPNAYEKKAEKSPKQEVKQVAVSASKKTSEKKIEKKSTEEESCASSSGGVSGESSPLVEESTPLHQEQSAKVSLRLDPRIVIWFEDKMSALKDPKYKDLNPYVQEKITVFHSIGLEVLDLLLEKGIKSQWGDRKLPHYSLACEVTITGHTSKYRGIITVCFNESGSIYHYGFTDKPANLIVSEYMNKRFWDLDFPPLEIAREKPVILPQKINPQDGSFFSRIINQHTFELIDNKNKTTVLLFLPDASTK